MQELAASNRDAALAATGSHGQTNASAESATSDSQPGGATKSSVPTPSLIRILPDDTPRDVGAEDVLPYFQFPGTVPTPPSPATLPPSSATYRQR